MVGQVCASMGLAVHVVVVAIGLASAAHVQTVRKVNAIDFAPENKLKGISITKEVSGNIINAGNLIAAFKKMTIENRDLKITGTRASIANRLINDEAVGDYPVMCSSDADGYKDSERTKENGGKVEANLKVGKAMPKWWEMVAKNTMGLAIGGLDVWRIFSSLAYVPEAAHDLIMNVKGMSEHIKNTFLNKNFIELLRKRTCPRRLTAYFGKRRRRSQRAVIKKKASSRLFCDWPGTLGTR